MKANAVICELNPLHDGHKYIISRAGESADVLILVMSGSFTERAVPAVYDKYARAEAAVHAGADLVVELPYPWCSAGVEGFARGGVKVAASLGADRLVFGSETGDFSLIEKAARIKSSEEYRRAALQAERCDRRTGSAEVFDEVMRQAGVLSPLCANDKLGAEYVRFGREAGINDFSIVKRIDTKSASEIRRTMPEAAATEERFDGLVFDYCRCGRTGDNPLVRYAVRVAHECVSAAEFISNLPTKKYTLARLRREILADMLDSVANPVDAPTFTVLLAANGRGREYLSAVRKDAAIELITKPADAKSGQFSVLSRADELFCLCAGLRGGEMLRKKPYII